MDSYQSDRAARIRQEAVAQAAASVPPDASARLRAHHEAMEAAAPTPLPEMAQRLTLALEAMGGSPDAWTGDDPFAGAL